MINYRANLLDCKNMTIKPTLICTLENNFRVLENGKYIFGKKPKI